MDAEAARQLTDAVENLTNVMYNAGGKLSGLGDAATKTSQSQLNYNKGVISGTEASLSYAEAQRKAKAAAKNMADAQDQAKAALSSFTTGLANTSTEFAKYNNALGSAGDAALSIGKNFGLLGLAIGGLIKGVTMVAQAATKQADNSLKATDEFNKMGAAGQLTAKSIAEMGIKIGLSNEQFALMPKALKRAGDSIVSLGATSADGQKKLMGMLAVTNEQREAFQRLGVNQEDLMGYQSDYVALQKASGVQITARMKQDGSLQKASLEYTSNLLQLSAISGKSVDEAAAMQKQAQAAYEIQIDNARITREIKQAELSGNTERVKQLEAERDSRNKMLNVVADIGDADITSGMQKFLATGAITEQSAAFAQMGVDMQGFRKRMQDGEDVSAEFAQALKDGIARKQEEVGTAAAYNKEVGKVFGLTEKTMSWAAARADVDEKKAREEAAKGVGKPAEEKTGKTSEEDPAQIARNKSTTLTIEFNRALETLLLESNPLMSGFNALTIAMTALVAAAGLAALALGALAAKSTLGTIADMATGPDGKGKGGAGKGRAGKLFGTLKNVGGSLLRGGVAVAGGAAVDYGLGKLGVGKDKEGKDIQVDEKQDDANWARMSTGQKMESGFLRGIEKAGSTFFLNNMSRQAQADRVKNETEYLNKNTPGAVPAGAPAAAPAGAPAGAPVSTSTTGKAPAPSTPNPTSASQLSEAGLKLKKGDVQSEGKHLDPRLIEIAKQVQAQVPGFLQFTGFNDQFHAEKAPGSLHAKGNAFDFTIAPKPTREKGAEIVAMLKGLGLDFALDEYNNASAKATGGHFHGHLKAYDGGVFEGPTAGYNVELHGREAIVPLPDPNSMISVSDEGATKEPLDTAMNKTSSGSSPGVAVDQLAGITQAMMQMMEYKFDEMISKLSDGNDIQTELLQYSKA